MKSSKNQKLTKFKLNHETVRRLGNQELAEIIGGISGSGQGGQVPWTYSFAVACCPN